MSNLLSQASLVMIPSGYKEDVVYSQIPTNGNGDLSFTRASNGTRINSAGVVEVCPWNLLQYSEDFSNAYWSKDPGATVDSNVATAPNGTSTADRLNFAGAGQAVYTIQSFNGANTFSVYLKGEGANIGKQIYLELPSGQNVTLTGEWQRFEVNADNASSVAIKRLNSGQASAVLAWGIQVNAGALKPYFPTTDRLNVPRLTYQNGGGGCPSLLLEKQSTNLLTYSEQFDNADWTKQSGVSVTANQTISPDGTQNADLVVGGGSSGIFQSGKTVSTTVANTKSVYLKGVSGGEVVRLQDPNQTIGFTVCTLTTSWQRFTLSEVQSGGIAGLWVTNIPSGGIYMWGAQLEDSPYATSLIYTTSSSATRVADACSKTGISSLIGSSEGTLFVDFVKSQDGYNYYNLSDGTNNNRIFIGQDADAPNRLRAYVRENGNTASVDINVGPVANGRYKMAIGYKLNDVVFYINGTLSGTDTSTAMPVGLSDFSLTNTTGGSASVTTNTNQVALFKTRLTNAELASLTTI